MANRSLGTLTWDLIVKIGGFERGLDQAARAADKRTREIAAAQKRLKQQIEREWSDVGKLIAGGIAGITIAGLFTKFITESKNAQNEQAQLAAVIKSTGQAAGYSAEQLNAMASAISGKSVFSEGDINRAQTRLLSYTNVVGEQFPEALQAAIDMASRLGTSVEQAAETVGKALDVPAEGLTALSKQGFRFTEDQKKLVESLQSTGRTAEAQKIILDSMKSAYAGAAEAARNTFGGAIAALQNQLNSLMTGNDGSLKGATDAVNELAKTLASPEVKAAFDSLTTLLANVIRLLAQATGEFVNFGKFVGESIAKAVHGSADPIERMNDNIADMRVELQALDKELARPRKFAGGGGYDSVDELANRASNLRKQIEGATKARDEMIRDANKPVAPPKVTPQNLPKPGAIPVKGSGKGDDTLKRQLESDIKALDRYISQQQDLLQERNRFLDLYNDQGLFSIKDYYERQANIRDEATQKQSEAYDKQIKLLQDYIAKANPKDRASAQEKLNDLLEKQAKLQRDAGSAAIEAGIKQTQATKEYQDAVQELNARLLELQGSLGAAAAIRFDMQNESLDRLLKANGNEAAREQLRQVRELTVAQADLNKLAADYSLIQGQLQIQEDRIALAQQMGTQSELGGLIALGKARRESYEQLKGIVEEFRAIAILSDNKNMILQAERLKLSFDQLGATLDPLADKIRSTFEDAFGSAFADFITGTKTAKEAFQDFAKSVVSEIAKLAAQQLAKQLFGGLFSSGGSSGSGGWLSSIIGLFGGGKASGGPVAPNTLYRVNERGPEMFQAANGEQFLMTGTQGGSITPNHMLGGGGNVFNITVPQGTSRQTGSQIAAEAARKLAQAQRNN